MAGISMVIADILSVLLVQAEARNRAHLAGLLDALGWGAAIIVTFITVTALQGHNMTEKVLVVLVISAANYAGSLIGVKFGSRFVHDATTLNDRVARLEELSTLIHDHKE